MRRLQAERFGRSGVKSAGMPHQGLFAWVFGGNAKGGRNSGALGQSDDGELHGKDRTTGQNAGRFVAEINNQGG